MANGNGEKWWTRLLYHAAGYLAAKIITELRRASGLRPWRRRPAAQGTQQTGGIKMAGLVATNEVVGNVIDSIRTLLISGTFYLRLFVNDFAPDAASTDPADYTEATFDTYNGILLDGAALGAWFLAGTGAAQINSAVFAWSPPATGGETVYGWWIESNGKVWFAGRFQTPQNVSSSSPPLAFVIRFQELARSILPC